MGLAVLADDPRAINADNCMSAHYRQIVHELIVTALQERGIYSKYRYHAVRSKTRTKRRGVLFGNADVKKSARQCLVKILQTGAVLHRGGHGANFLIVVSHIKQFFAENSRKAVGRDNVRVARSYLKRADTVKFAGVRLSGRIAVTFNSIHHHDRRAMKRFRRGKLLFKLGNVMTVNGADKFKAEILEHRAVENNIF